MHTDDSAETPVSHDAGSEIIHETTVFKAGNSLAIRISSALARQADLESGTAVELVFDQDTLRVRKAQSRELNDLIARITADNLHEPEFDYFIGAERW